VRKAKDSRSLETEDQIFSITVEEALVVFAQPRRRAGQRKAAEPLKELGTDPVSEGVITLREGRFGHYVTDGETNASLRKEDDPNSITPERAQELLQLRREAGPSKKKAKKKTTKKSAAKKTTAKKATAKQATTEKVATKKVATKKVAAKKTTAKKASTKKATAKKATAKKAAAKKTSSKKAAAEKAPGE
jgi:DNA topoisomerase-1